MYYYFGLNFLSFESNNLMYLFFSLKNKCSLHGAHSTEYLKPFSLNIGYPVSYSYKQLHQLFRDKGVFILIKESPKSVLNHLMFGYYNNLFNEIILNDFKNYFQITINNLDEEKLKVLMDNYYTDVEQTIGEKLIIADLSQHNDSFVNFICSSDFIVFAEKLNNGDPDYGVTGRAIGMQKSYQGLLGGEIKDYFVTSPYYAIPSSYPLNSWMGDGFHKRPPTALGDSYLANFLSQFDNDESMFNLWDANYRVIKIKKKL